MRNELIQTIQSHRINLLVTSDISVLQDTDNSQDSFQSHFYWRLSNDILLGGIIVHPKEYRGL